MNAEQIVSLVTEFFNHASGDPDTFRAMQAKMEELRRDPATLPVALELLTNYQQQTILWFASGVIDNLIIYHWVPRSMNPDPSKSSLPVHVKLQLREFFVQFLNDRIDLLEPETATFIYRVIVTSIKVDFHNEGIFWLSYIQDKLAGEAEIHKAMLITRHLSDDLQPLADHTIPSSVRNSVKQAFFQIIPDVTKTVIQMLQSGSIDERSLVEAFKLLQSFLHWIAPGYFSFELVEVILNYSKYSMGPVALLAHQCISSLFSRIDVGSVHTREFRAQLLRMVIEFFECEMRNFGNPGFDSVYVQSLLRAFQPFAANYFFKQNEINASIIVRFLQEFEGWTWALLGTGSFAQMLEIWSDLLHGSDQTDCRMQFRSVVEHVLEAMISPEHMSKFTEDDYHAANDFINEAATSHVDDSISRLVQRATAYAVNLNLPSVGPLMTCFFHVIYLISEGDPVNESISDSLLRYTNELMTKNPPVDVEQVFPVVQTIIKSYVRKFARNSDHFVEKVFHLVTVSMTISPTCLQPLMELLLETLKIDRPQTPCKMILERLMTMHEAFCSMKLEIYSLYICCCETIAAFNPTDGGNSPLANVETIQQIFRVVFDNLSAPEKVAISLSLLKDAINNIAFSTRATKDLVFHAMMPYIDAIMSIYEEPNNGKVLGSLLDFIASYCRVFLTQIAERMSEFINRLFAPLERVLPSLAAGSFEHLATMAFLNILYQLASFRNPVADLQTVNITTFLLTYSEPLLKGQSVEVMRLSLMIVKTLIKDRWQFLTQDLKVSLLRLVFRDGVCAEDPDSVKISIDALIEGHRFHQVLDLVDTEFRFQGFRSICTEMCRCSQTMMRDQMVDFAVFFCAVAPDFKEMMLVPFIQQLPIEESDRETLVGLFSSFQNEIEFKKIFITFCDDVAYLTSRMDVL